MGSASPTLGDYPLDGTFGDLEDDIPEGQPAGNFQTDLFGDDDEDEPHVPAPPAPDPAMNEAAERRRALQKIAAAHRGGSEGGKGGKDKDKKKPGAKKPKRGREEPDGPAAGAGRRRRAMEAREPEERAAPVRRGAADPDALFGAEEDDEEVAVAETDADREFIDDAGVPEEHRYLSDDEAAIGDADEAMEVAEGEEELDEVDKLLKGRRRGRGRESEGDVAAKVDDMIAQMDAAAEADAGCHQERRPAVHKLRALESVESLLLQRRYHEAFITSNGLHVLNRWLAPYPDGTLPSLKVRSTILKLVAELPIDTSNEHIKSLLGKSDLGRTVMFMFKNTEETPANQRAAKELVQRWSRPIFADPELEERKRYLKQRQLEEARRKGQHAQRVDALKREAEMRQRLELRPNEPGFRRSAAIPMAAKLDFVVNPGSRQVEDDTAAGRVGGAVGGGGGGGASGGSRAGPPGGRLGKTLREQERKRRGLAARAANVSVEGRTINIIN